MSTKMPLLDWKHEPLAESFRAFKARMELYLEDQSVTDPVKKATKIKIAIGDEGIRRILASGLDTTEQKDPTKVWQLLEDQLDASVKINYRVHRLEFSHMRQKPEETISDYMSRMREKAAKCEFSTTELNERLIEMIILSTPFEDLRKDLLAKPKGFAIADVLAKGREYEALQASEASLKSMNATAAATNVDAVHKTQTCGNCGLHHKSQSCPASQSKCGGCSAMGHWKKMCRKTNRRGDQKDDKDQAKGQHGQGRRPWKRPWKKPWHGAKGKPKSQNEVQVLEDEGETYSKSFYSISIGNISLNAVKDEAYTTLMVEYPNSPVTGTLRIKVDTGAGGNTLPLRTYQQMFGSIPTSQILTPEPSTTLTSYSGHRIKCLGSINLHIRKANQAMHTTQKFYVIDVPGPAILGLPTCELLGVVQLNVDAVKHISKQAGTQPDLTTVKESAHHAHHVPPSGTKLNTVDDLKHWFPDCFDGIGCFVGEEQLHIKPDATPFIDPPRRCPIHLRDKIEGELQRMEDMGIIRPVTTHTDWCSSLTYAAKKDGSLRICLDPQKLNQALKRCPHKIPTVEEITPAFTKAKYFTKLDAKAGYWSIQLAQPSQELTTFRSPFGRFCFTRLPFGLCVSQDLFQQHMDRIIEQCEGVVGISDDLVIYGDTEEQHDARVLNFFKVARKEGLMLNSEKCIIKTNRIAFFGRMYTDEGVFPDPKKVEDIISMPTPQDKQDLQRFLGMATFLSSHVPQFSSRTATLRDLLKGDTPFDWSEDHQHAFEQIKQCMASNVGLKYYDPSCEVNLEVDASMKGLGAALVQKEGPVVFASKALTTAESNYSNIERECLAVVHGIQRFHYYLYGRHFTVVTDHKPLEMIFQKPIHAAPPRLQRMMLKVQGYDFKVIYRPGSEMVLADTLSRLPNQKKDRELELDNRVDSILFEDVNNIDIDLMNFSPVKQSQIREETSKDAVLNGLAQVIFTGWPEKIQELPTDLREFWCYRDELAVENGIIFKGRQVLIPEPLRPDVLKQLHSGHQGIEKTRRLARESVYWCRIYKDIETLCKNCEFCQELQPQQPKEPMHMHEKPGMPWTKLGTDLFEIDGKNYLIIADYFSRFPVIKQLRSTTAADIVAATKEAFSMLGVPREIVSDNGPQFLSKYNQFCSEWGILHTTSSPRHAQSNGFIERQIRYLKPIIKKCLKSDGDINAALLNVRATPLDATLPSPAELMFGRRISTTLPSHTNDMAPDHYREHVKELSEKQKAYADQHTRELPPLLAGKPVRVLDKERKLWYEGQIIARNKDRSYQVLTEGGRSIIRNRAHLREIPPTPEPKAANTMPERETRQPTPQCANDNQPTQGLAQPAPQPSSPMKATPKPQGQPVTPMMTRSGRVIQKPARLIEK